MRITLTLFSLKQQGILPVNYNYFLTSLIYKIIQNSSEDYSRFLHDEGYRLGESKKGFKLFTYSMLRGERFKVTGDKVIFSKGRIRWQISSPLDIFLQHLITGVFAEGQKIEIGPEDSKMSLIIERVETLPRPEFKETMYFTCLSPITVSTCLNRSNGLNGLNCHYLRPWEEGFSEAIKNNLIKKYKLIYGKDIWDSGFKITVDTEYMNRKNGRITKNINFKGTNIIGFMAPFEVTGKPELIEIGYETGFGEKGSMGFGMVKSVGTA